MEGEFIHYSYPDAWLDSRFICHRGVVGAVLLGADPAIQFIEEEASYLEYSVHPFCTEYHFIVDHYLLNWHLRKCINYLQM